MNLEGMMLSEIRSTEEDPLYDLSHMQNLKELTDKSIRFVVATSGGKKVTQGYQLPVKRPRNTRDTTYKMTSVDIAV